MKNLGFVLAIIICVGRSYAQCVYSPSLGSTIQAPSTVGQTVIISNVFAGQFVRVSNMRKDYVYEVTTCNNSQYDTKISIFTQGGGELLAYNDDACGGTGSLVQFSPFFNASYDIALHESVLGGCASNTITTNLEITLIRREWQIIDIPVVFHLINYDIFDSIRDKQVFWEVELLNKAFNRDQILFNRLPSFFKGISGSLRVNFCLAQQDPNGNPTTGIERRKTSLQQFLLEDQIKHTSLGGLDAWDRSRYLNVWVGDASQFLGAFDPCGYSTRPGSNLLASNDGVVIDYSCFLGNYSNTFNYDDGKTLVHEVGHWLGLDHIWGTLPFGTCWDDDNIDDTPNQKGKGDINVNYAPVFYPDDCSPHFPGVMHCNFMDYAADPSINMFTVGQCERMRSVLNGFRSSLQSSVGCNPVVVNCPIGSICISNTTQNVCNGTYYDDGSIGSYVNGSNYVQTFSPTNTGMKLKFDFSFFETEQNLDVLKIFDGGTISSPLIGIYSGDLAPFSIIATNPSGELTFKWSSNSFHNGAGWIATMSCVNNDLCNVPPGNYKYIHLSGLNLNQQTNQLEFLLQGVTAQNGEPTVDILVEVEKIKKRFKQALAIPAGSQWISLNITPDRIGDATSGVNFQNTDLARDFFEADVNLKFSSVFKPIVGFSPYTGNYTDWNNLIYQGPFTSQIQALPNLYYPHWCVYSGIHSKNINYSSQGPTKIIINNAFMEMHRGILWAELSNGVNNLASNLRSTLLSKMPPYKNQLLQRLDNGVNITTPLVNISGTAFQQLRNSYRITAAAHWYKTLVSYSNKPYHSLINSNNLNGVMVNPPYNDAYWDDQALQPLPHLHETFNYYNNMGIGSYSCVGGLSMGSYTMVDTGAFNLTQNTIDSSCFYYRSYTLVDTFAYFYGGVLDYNIADLVGTIQLPSSNRVLGDTVHLNATVFNFGNRNAQQFTARLYEQYTNAQNQLQTILIGQQIISNIDSFSNQNLLFNWIPLTYGSKKLILTVDEGNQVIEKKETNNTATDSLLIQNNTPSVSIIFPSNGSSITNQNVALTGNAYDPRDGYLNFNNLSWTSNIDGFLGNGSFVIVDSLSVGNHTITFTGTNSHGQIAFEYINVFVFPQGYPLVSISSPVTGNTFADNVPILFMGNAIDLDDGNLCGPSMWVSNISGNIGAGCNLSTSLPIGNHTITFSVQNSSGNTSSGSTSVNVIDGKPHITINNPLANSSYFQNQTVTLTGIATDFPQGNISSSIRWSSNIQGFLGTGPSLTVSLLPGIHTISASVQDNAGSTSTATVSAVSIRYNPPVPVIIQPLTNQTFLYHDTIKFIGHANDIQDGAMHGNKLKWYSNVQGFIGFGDTVQTTILTYGYHTISLKANDSNGNDSIVSVSNIYVDAGLPAVNITQPPNGAISFFGSSVTFSGTATDPQDGALTGSSLQWSSDANGVLGTGNSISSNSLSAGNQTVRLTASDQDGFISSSTVNLYIEPPHPPVVSIYYPFNNNHFLHGTGITLRATAIDYEEGVLNDNRITWSSSLNGNLGTGKTISVSNLSPGSHVISVSCTDITGLTTTGTIQIFVDQQKPIAQIISPVSGSVFAQGTTVTFTGSATDYEDGPLAGNSLQWSSSINGSIGNGNSINASALAVGSHLIKLIASDSQNAKDTSSSIVIIQAPNTVLLTKFSDGNDSISALFGSDGGDTIVYVPIPRTATVLNAQAHFKGTPSFKLTSPEWVWAKSAGGSGRDYSHCVSTDNYGNVYIAGSFDGNSITFGGVTLTNTNSGNRDLFVAKYDPNGNLLWANSHGGTSDEYANGIASDSKGNVYVVGQFYSPTITFDSILLSNVGSYDVFITKYDNLGRVVWVKSAQGISYEYINSVYIDASNNIYITGSFESPTLTFDTINLSTNATYALFVTKYDSSGNVLWARSSGGTSTDFAYSITADKYGNAYITGGFTSTSITFGSFTLTKPTFGRSPFVVKYDSLGNVLWAKSAEGSTSTGDIGHGLAVDTIGNLYLTGKFRSASMTFDTITLNNSGISNYDAFIVKYDMLGNVIWAKNPIGTSSGNSISVDRNGSSYVTGTFSSSTITFDSIILNRINSNNIFITKYNSEGNVLWATNSEGFNSEIGSSIRRDLSEDIYLTGYYTSSNLTFGSSILTNSGNEDCFLLKLRDRKPSYPYNPYFDVANDTIFEWSYSGSYNLSQISSDFSNEINTFLRSYSGSSYFVQVPITLHSDSAGVLKVTDLDLQYLLADTIPPNFITAQLVPNSLAKNSSFTAGVRVSDNEKLDSVKAKFKNNVYALSEVSGDSFAVSILADTVGYFPVTITVSDTNGLTHDTVLYVTVYSATSDLEVLSSNIHVLPAGIFTNDSVHLSAIVKNNSNLTITNAQIVLIIDGVTQQSIPVTLSSFAQAQIYFDWLAKWGQDTITIKADPSNVITEANENNNTGVDYIFVNDIYPPLILQATANPNPAYVGNQVFFQVKAIDSTGIASVYVNWQSQNILLTYNSFTSFYEGYATANTSGTSDAVFTVYDVNGLSSLTTLSIQVLQSLPDLKVYSSDILFAPTISGSGSNATIQIRVHNSGNVDVASVNVVLHVDGLYAGSQSASVLHDSSSTFLFSWQVTCGNHTYTIIVDSANSITETIEDNNTTSVVHQFCASVPSYALNAQAIPSVISLGSTTSVQLTSIPATSSANVTVIWNNQNVAMPFDSLNNNYAIQIYPSNTGNFTLPIWFTDSNGYQSAAFVQFTVVDSLPDLSVDNFFINYPIIANTNSQFTIAVSNNSLLPILNSTIYLLADSQVVDSLQISYLSSLDSTYVQLNWHSAVGVHQLTAITDLYNHLQESIETNNSKTVQLNIEDNEPPVIHFVNTSIPTYQGVNLNVSSYVTDNDSVVSVVANFMGTNYLMQYDSIVGTWKVFLNTPVSGTFPLTISATDNSSLTTSALVSIMVNDTLPDLEIKAQNIMFTHVDSVTNTVVALIQNRGGGVANNAKLNFNVNGVLRDSLLLDFLAGQSDTVIFTFNYSVGFHTINLAVDPGNSISESNETNNSASRNIFIPDLTSPSTPMVTVTPSSWSASPNFTVSWNQVFDSSGTVSYEYSINGSIWTNVGTSLSASVTANSEGLSYVYLRAKDVFGNLSEPGFGEMKYDNTAPNAPLIAEYHCGTSWTTHESPQIEWLNPGDVGSGIQYFEVSLDNGAATNIGFNFFNHDSLNSGIHTLKVRAVDYVGHTGNWSNVVTVNIDLDSPGCPNILSPTHPNQRDWYQNDSVVLNWNHPSETSSVTGFFYMLNHDSTFFADQTSYWIGEDSLTLTTILSMDTSRIRLPDGVWYVHLTSQDTVGHLSVQSCSYRFMIDKTAPFTSATHSDSVVGCNYSFGLRAEDYYSGVANTFYRVNNGNWINDTVVLLTSPGNNFVEFYSVDSAGNSERFDTATVYLGNNNLSLNLGNDTTVCGNILVTAPSGYNYLWSTGDTVSAVQITNSQNLTLQITDGSGCSVADNLNITVIDVPVSNFSFIQSVDSVAFTNLSQGSTSYIWQFGDGDTSSMVNPSHIFIANGTYTITLTANSDSCGSSVHVDSIQILNVMISEVAKSENSFYILPNPNNGLFYLVAPNKFPSKFKIYLTNPIGQLVEIGKRTDEELHKVGYDVSTLPAGIYHLVIVDEDTQKVLRLVKF